MQTQLIPQKIEPRKSNQNPPEPTKEIEITWNTGETFALPYLDLRYYCPCAACVDEHTGKRTVKRESLNPEVRLTGAQVVGRYGLHLKWSDGHSTGMVHFDNLYELCKNLGTRI